MMIMTVMMKIIIQFNQKSSRWLQILRDQQRELLKREQKVDVLPNANMELDSTGEAKASFTVVGKDLLQQIEVDENEEMHEEYDIPAKMCSIIKVSSYHHEGDTSPMYSSSSDYDFIINFGSQKGSPPLSIPESDVQPSYQSIESQSVNQMFSSLYDTLSTWSELDEKLFTTMDYKFNHQLSPLPTKTDDGSWLPLARNLLSITGMKFHNERSVVSTLLATFPMLIYFTTDISNIPTPFSYYEENHSLFSTILSDQFESSTNTLITTLKQTIYENFAKLIYSIRVPQQSTTLESIKSAMTITYTHLQTIEIQQSHQSKTTSLLKLVHYVSEILVLKLDDSSITNENSTVQHYLEMFVDEYRSTLEESDSTGSSLLNSPITNGMVCSPVTEVSDEELDDRRYIIGMLLLIAGCVSKSMEHREFIAKEMYIMKRQSDNEWFEFSLLGLKLEDLWCREERNEVSALDCLFDRVGFDDCLV
ncbi:hypothetical protein CANARDRAFT_132964 [[Candida] arabinofermentans NRRL YB-2248]|uniref:Uncharacterized protein n=1 Tax=[Candida] arabinofermentans NRRL YB-2248 TaxID=983967 RepID=A0A1E4T3E6_9ASCO|nr:hypothetical protein CANARDRAFT_132964 [[Candida] arabinofermentans NRRL YB-2248]